MASLLSSEDHCGAACSCSCACVCKTDVVCHGEPPLGGPAMDARGGQVAVAQHSRRSHGSTLATKRFRSYAFGAPSSLSCGPRSSSSLPSRPPRPHCRLNRRRPTTRYVRLVMCRHPRLVCAPKAVWFARQKNQPPAAFGGWRRRSSSHLISSLLLLLPQCTGELREVTLPD
jgi:hypothetical protein